MEPPAGTILSLLLSDNTTKWSYSRDETSVAPLRLGHIYDILLFILATGVKSCLPAVQYKTVSSKAASEWSTDGWIGKRLSFRLSGAFDVTRY